MTDHYIDLEYCRRNCAEFMTICLAHNPSGLWNPYIKAQSGPCLAILQKGKE